MCSQEYRSQHYLVITLPLFPYPVLYIFITIRSHQYYSFYYLLYEVFLYKNINYPNYLNDSSQTLQVLYDEKLYPPVPVTIPYKSTALLQAEVVVTYNDLITSDITVESLPSCSSNVKSVTILQ